MKRAPRSRQRHDLYAKYHDYDSEISDLLGECGLDLVGRIRAARPDILLTSDFIVGFPGETDADFQATVDLVRAVGFGAAFSFRYSARPGTPAAEKPPVPAALADERLQVLQALITEQQHAAQRAMIGREVAVLYEKPGRLPGQMVGKSQHLMAVHVADPTGRPGDLIRARVAASASNSLAAERIRG
jgi:tRNA-2-methylthio-N6-dimethylallyladenosine synthase